MSLPLTVQAVDYPANIDYGSIGDFVSKFGGDKGRITTISPSGPILISSTLHSGSSSVGIKPDFTDAAWDLSDPNNPQLINRYNCHEGVCYRGGGPQNHSHITTYYEGKAYLNTGRYWLLGGSYLTHNPNGKTSIEKMLFQKDPLAGIRLGEEWRYSHLTSPYDTISYWDYHFEPSKTFQIRNTDRVSGVSFADWDHARLTGVTGFPIFLGNLLVFVSDQQQTGMAIYDISGMHEGQSPRLISYLNPDLHVPPPILPVEPVPEKLGGYWVDSYGTNKIVWAARRRGISPRREYPSMFVVDITDPVNPYISCELYFAQDFSNPHDGDLRDSGPMYVNFQDQYAYVDHFKVDIPACESAYAEDKKVDAEEFSNIVYKFNDTENNCESGQYFRPLGQLGLFSGGDLWSTHTIIEHTGGPLEAGNYQQGIFYNVHRNSQPGVYRSGTPITGFRVSRNLSDDTIAIPKGYDVQVGDTLYGNGKIFTVTKISIPDERVNEQGMCVFVTSDEPDNNPPYVSGHMPRANQTNVPVDSFIHFHIPETLRTDTLSNAVAVTNVSRNKEITFQLQSSHTGTVSIFPHENMIFGEQYRVDIKGVQDYMGNTMLPYSFSFTTGESLYQDIHVVPDRLAPKFEGQPYYPKQSSSIACYEDKDKDLVWTVNPDNHSVSVLETYTDPETFEVTTNIRKNHISRFSGKPTSVTKVGSWLAVAFSDDDKVRFYSLASQWKYGTAPSAQWVTSFDYGDNPISVVAYGHFLYVALYNSGEIVKIDTNTRQVVGRLVVGPKPKAMALTNDGARLLVARFISNKEYAEVYDVSTAGALSFRDPNQKNIRINKVLVPDDIDHGSGVPNYLRSIVIGPNDEVAYITANKANIDRGLYLNGEPLDDDNTIRPMIAMIDLINHRDINTDPIQRKGTIDLDNSADPAGIIILPDGITRMHVLQGNNVAEFVNVKANKISRVSTGFAPQGSCATERNVYIKNYTDRSVSVVDIANYMYSGATPLNLQTLVSVSPEDDVHSAEELLGLQMFYHARAPDVSPEGYISCGSCHDDGGHDGMTWDLTHMGEGLRNTISLRGSSGTRFGHLHWTSNFDEVQDFEAQIEGLNGADGLIKGITFSQNVSPLIHVSEGYSDELDALAVYVSSLGKSTVLKSPESCPWGGVCSIAAGIGGWKFINSGCIDCHSGSAYRDGKSHDVGTIATASGKRLGFPLTEIRTPTLVELWDTAPYFHDGSAATLEDVFVKGHHANSGLNNSELSYLIMYLKNLDRLDFIADDIPFNP